MIERSSMPPLSALVASQLRPASVKATAAAFPSPAELFYHNSTSKEFARRAAECKQRALKLLSLYPGFDAEDAAEDVEGELEALEALTCAVDAQLDRADASLAAHKRDLEDGSSSGAPSTLSSGVWKKDHMLPHAPNTARPQDLFTVKPDNSNAPFMLPAPAGGPAGGKSAGLAAVEQRALGGQRNPIADELLALQYPEWQLQPGTPKLPEPMETCELCMVDTPQALEAMVHKLKCERELAVDLENHHQRSFMGFTPLMQISTRHQDFLVDNLALRDHLHDALGPIFRDPSVLKVLHGADRDIIWLQRDFGIYVVNMFDTGQAARELQMSGCGLAYLLSHLCGVTTDKRYQLADWRTRPLTPEMQLYARTDTHYLLYIHDRLLELLAQKGEGCIKTVLDRSRDLCMNTFEKELLSPTSYLEFYKRCDRQYSAEQLGVLAAVYAWRDRVARQEDESTGYVLPKAALLRVCDAMPQTVQHLQGLCRGSAPVALKHAQELVDVVASAREQAAACATDSHSILQAAGTHTRLASPETHAKGEGSVEVSSPKLQGGVHTGDVATAEAPPPRRARLARAAGVAGGLGGMLGAPATTPSGGASVPSVQEVAAAGDRSQQVTVDSDDAAPQESPPKRSRRTRLVPLASTASSLMGSMLAHPAAAPSPKQAASQKVAGGMRVAGPGCSMASMMAPPSSLPEDEESKKAAEAARLIRGSMKLPSVTPCIENLPQAAPLSPNKTSDDCMVQTGDGPAQEGQTCDSQAPEAPITQANNELEEMITLGPGPPKEAKPNRHDRRSQENPQSLAETYGLTKRKNRRDNGGVASAAHDQLRTSDGPADMTYTWEARSEHATEKAKKSRKQFGKDATLAEFTTEGKFDYEAARSASPFGSGFGLLAGSGTATTSKARNDAKRKGRQAKSGWFSKEMVPLEQSDWKAGKKPQVFPRSGNRTFSFKK